MIKTVASSIFKFMSRTLLFSVLFLGGGYVVLAILGAKQHDVIFNQAGLPVALGEMEKLHAFTDHPSFEVTRTYLVYRLPYQSTGLDFCGKDGFGAVHDFYFHPLASRNMRGCEKAGGGPVQIHVTEHHVLITHSS